MMSEDAIVRVVRSADRQRQSKRMSKALMDDGLEQALDAVSRMAKTVLAPWSGAAACLDAYEAAIRAVTDAQRSVARVIAVEPARSFVASCADLTRDIAAAQLSRVRWVLDV